MGGTSWVRCSVQNEYTFEKSMGYMWGARSHRSCWSLPASVRKYPSSTGPLFTTSCSIQIGISFNFHPAILALTEARVTSLPLLHLKTSPSHLRPAPG